MFHPEATVEATPPANEDLGDMKPFNTSTRKPLKKLNERFDRAVSHEISRRVRQGNMKLTDMEKVIAGKKFQEDTLKQVLPQQ